MYYLFLHFNKVELLSKFFNFTLIQVAVDILEQEFIDLCYDIAAQKASDYTTTLAASTSDGSVSSSATIGVSNHREKGCPRRAALVAFSDFNGLPTHVCIYYRTGDPWPPMGLTQPVLKSCLRVALPVHPIQKVWSRLGTQICKFLDSD
jgi:hypothetical protein